MRTATKFLLIIAMALVGIGVSTGVAGAQDPGTDSGGLPAAASDLGRQDDDGDDGDGDDDDGGEEGAPAAPSESPSQSGSTGQAGPTGATPEGAVAAGGGGMADPASSSPLTPFVLLGSFGLALAFAGWVALRRLPDDIRVVQRP